MKLAVFLFALVLAAAPPPTPEAFFGHRMGADRSSLEWNKVVRYFDQLAGDSDRVDLRRYGKSTLGRDMIAAFIADPQTLRDLEQYRQIQEKLADPRKAQESELPTLLTRGKTVVLITCAIHSTEVASTHTAVEFAHRMATANDSKTQAILHNTILILVPSLNPDGTDLVTNWYRKTLGTPYEGTTPPELYQKYVGHDNNRDWYMFTQAETRATISQLHNVWHPQIVYDVHQQGATSSRMFVPPWLDPIDPNVDPIIAQLSNAIGMGAAFDLTAAGRKGVSVNALYDFWTPARHYQSYHGGVRILSESASVRLSTPITLRREDINERAQGYSPRERSWNHLEPWPGGKWTLRDIVDDQLIVMESVAFQAAQRREDMLRAFLKVGQKALLQNAPYTYIIRRDQADPGATLTLLQTLQFGGVEILEASDNFRVNDTIYPQGTFLIRMQQPYSAFAKTLLERQQYPDLRLYPGGPPRQPYDVTAQTLPLLMGVDVIPVGQVVTAATRPARLTVDLRTRGVLAASDSNSWKAVFRAWSQGQKVWRNPQSGDFVISDRAQEGFQTLLPKRVGLYKSIVPSMDEGWTRWIFEQFQLAYRSVGNADIKAGDLKSKYDVIIFPDQSPAQIATGYREGSMPPEYVGGLGEQGAAALKQFVNAGGRLVFLNDSCAYAQRQLGVSIKEVTEGVPNRDLYVPGSLLNVRAEASHPLLLGLPKFFSIWSEQSPAYQPAEGQRAILRYTEENLLASGWLLGEKLLARTSPLVEIPQGSGQIILFGMRPQYRAQSYLTFKLLFNAIAY